VKCSHFEDSVDVIKGSCWKAQVNYEISGFQCGEMMQCQHNGDVQKCLDELISLNDQGILWKDHITVNILQTSLRERKKRSKPVQTKGLR
jgi:hypothetical protein